MYNVHIANVDIILYTLFNTLILWKTQSLIHSSQEEKDHYIIGTMEFSEQGSLDIENHKFSFPEKRDVITGRIFVL